MRLLDLLLCLGMCVGHTALLVYSINWWYAQPLNHRFLFCLRMLIGLLVLAGWGAFAWAFALRFNLPAEALSNDIGQVTVGIYAIACLLLGLLVVPAITLYRLVRPAPRALASNHTATVDVARELRYKPYGKGRYQLLARLPRNEIFTVDFTEKTLHLPRLPAAWDGLSILHLSDLHLRGTPDRRFYQFVMDRCRAWEPDLLTVTGDIVDSDDHHRWILPVLGKLRWTTAAFGILGNHDKLYDTRLVARRMQKLGIRMLGNGWTETLVRGERLVVLGHEGPWFKPEPDLANCPVDGFRLCLSHTPDNIRWAQRQKVDLMLSGHNHGGQVRFPILGSLLVPSSYSRRYDCGTFSEPPTLLHVSRGLGAQHPLRYNCRPEVTKIVLRCGS